MATHHPPRAQDKRSTSEQQQQKPGAAKTASRTQKDMAQPLGWSQPATGEREVESRRVPVQGGSPQKQLERTASGTVASSQAQLSWWPEVSVRQRDGKLVVSAAVPNLKADELRVEIRNNQLCISGERRTESTSQDSTYYRTERSYGSFVRAIPLPEGAKADSAKATLENGVLEVEIESPGSEAAERRRNDERKGSPS